MVYRVVSTKLSEDEHDALLDECGRAGESPSAFVKKAILEALKVEKSQLPMPSNGVKAEKKMVQPQSEASKLNAILEKFIKEMHIEDEQVKANNSPALLKKLSEQSQKQAISVNAEVKGESNDLFSQMSLVERLCTSNPLQGQGGKCHVYYRCSK